MILRAFQTIVSLQPDSQLGCQRVKLKTAAFPTQQLFLHSYTASRSQPQPAQTKGPFLRPPPPPSGGFPLPSTSSPCASLPEIELWEGKLEI
jgi:hypothetical protein